MDLSQPTPTGANVSEQLGDLGSVGGLANCSSWREVSGGEAAHGGFVGAASQALSLPWFATD